MSRRPALTDTQAREAELWFREYERVGTFEAKARSLGIDDDTLRDAIKRVRGLETKPQRQKLTHAEIVELVDLVAHEAPRETPQSADNESQPA